MMYKSVTKTLKVSHDTRDKMVNYYKNSMREKTPPYAVFQADDGDTVITLYESGKVVFQGRDADLVSSFWIETEKGHAFLPNEMLYNDTDKKDIERVFPLNVNTIGSDEVGTGDYFGPIIVTATYVDKSKINYLLSLGVKDSKKLSDEQIMEIVPEIIKEIPYTTYMIRPKEYNSYQEESINMNKIKAILHNKVLSEMITKNNYPYDYIVVDKFEEPRVYYHHIDDAKHKIFGIKFITKAEDECLAVACASLISRYLFLKEMTQISKDVGMEIPKGANNEVVKVAKKILKEHGEDYLCSIVKLNFKTSKEIFPKKKKS